jgi:hypothetical protein
MLRSVMARQELSQKIANTRKGKYGMIIDAVRCEFDGESGQIRIEKFIRIQLKDPVISCRRGAKIPLFREAWPGIFDDPSPIGDRDFNGAITAAAVDDQNFIDKING